ncbi:hypothetical protein Ddye_000018 [Dipteronia dyeriana]|uniref:AAA+ ATPase domain-containing protein n=1 Tax=Dipteronia dyeriana TaxID=168575 RepID=A0AAD9XKZ5_9ROSI|nr:hypothetical protein Ddye_000018 [Dipteronia dyeriana]
MKASSWASSFKADFIKQSNSLLLSVDDHEEVTDEFHGVKVCFLRHHREFISGSYIDHVIKEGKALALKNRQRKMYSNTPCIDWNNWKIKWSCTCFEHTATFDTLAMESKKKEEIMNDLKKFSEAKEYYAKIGKSWKRGYLLFGPPGTGKSTMIAAMANFLNYDVYDIELTIVKSNRELKSLLINTSSKSLIVVEDIDCSLNLTGQRQSKSDSEYKSSEVTLSGLLNFVDGLWSASAGERIVVFTTNHVDKLDPALIRSGRMDKHIEMSYCCFEAFKVLAKNYLDIDSHELFAEIDSLLAETNMTPADVAKNITPKPGEEEDNIAESCLKNLIKALKEVKPVNGEEEERVDP